MLRQLLGVTSSLLLLAGSIAVANEQVKILKVDFGELHCIKYPQDTCDDVKGQIGYFVVNPQDHTEVYAVYYFAPNPWNNNPDDDQFFNQHAEQTIEQFVPLNILVQTYCDFAGITNPDKCLAVTNEVTSYYNNLAYLRPVDQKITIHSKGSHALVMTITAGEKIEFRVN